MATRWRRERRTVSSVVAAVTFALATASGALAGHPDSVDPALMTPPLNPTFTWECWRNATGIVCDGERTTTYTAVEAIPCPDNGWIYATGTERSTLRRVGDADGRALSAFATIRVEDQLSRTPEFDGLVTTARGAWTDSFEYAIPGDLSSRTVTRRGADVVITVPGRGLVVLDVGIKSWDIEDTILFERGPHALVEDIEGAFEAACDALAGES